MGIELSVWGPGDPSTPQRYQFSHGRVLIGRGSGVDVMLPHAAVSHLHASLRACEEGVYRLVDEASTNGTVLRDKRLEPHMPTLLQEGDSIRVGPFRMQVSLSSLITQSTTASRTHSLARVLLQQVLQVESDVSTERVLEVWHGKECMQVVPCAEEREAVLGRDEACDIVLDDRSVSRRHAVLHVREDGAWIEDLGGKNALVVNGRRCRKARLHDGDRIRIGVLDLVYKDPLDAELAFIRAAEVDGTIRGPLPPTQRRALETLRETLRTPSSASEAQEEDAVTGWTSSRSQGVVPAHGERAGGEKGRVGEVKGEQSPISQVQGNQVQGGQSRQVRVPETRHVAEQDSEARSGSQRAPSGQRSKTEPLQPEQGKGAGTSADTSSWMPGHAPSQEDVYPAPRKAMRPEIFVYGLAAVVLVASIFGLIWVLRGDF